MGGHSSGVWSVAVSPDGTKVVSGSRDKTVRIWDLASGKQLHTLSGHSDSVRLDVRILANKLNSSGLLDHEVKEVKEVKKVKEVYWIAPDGNREILRFNDRGVCAAAVFGSK